MPRDPSTATGTARVALLLACLAAFSVAGCRQPPPPAAAPGPDDSGAAATESPPAAAACRGDGECASGFCDLGACAEPAGVYGRPCEPPPRTADGLRDGKLRVCGAYLCLDGRCRSCESDEQCRSEVGARSCYQAPDRPGSRCGVPLTGG